MHASIASGVTTEAACEMISDSRSACHASIILYGSKTSVREQAEACAEFDGIVGFQLRRIVHALATPSVPMALSVWTFRQSRMANTAHLICSSRAGLGILASACEPRTGKRRSLAQPLIAVALSYHIEVIDEHYSVLLSSYWMDHRY